MGSGCSQSMERRRRCGHKEAWSRSPISKSRSRCAAPWLGGKRRALTSKAAPPSARRTGRLRGGIWRSVSLEKREDPACLTPESFGRTVPLVPLSGKRVVDTSAWAGCVHRRQAGGRPGSAPPRRSVTTLVWSWRSQAEPGGKAATSCALRLAACPERLTKVAEGPDTPAQG